MKKIGLSLLATLLLAACATQEPVKETAPAAATPVPVAKAEPAKAEAPKAAEPKKEKYVEPFDPMRDASSILSQREVYFDFNKYDVKEEASDRLKAHSEYVTKTADKTISLQGHADERGTAEYNLALGQKRADAVKQAMVTAYGVDAAKLSTMSLGKEKPAMAGHNEEAWAANRRVEIVYSNEFKFPKN